MSTVSSNSPTSWRDRAGKPFKSLQKVGKAFMLPIAVLPAAGLLLGVGGSGQDHVGPRRRGLAVVPLVDDEGAGRDARGVEAVGAEQPEHLRRPRRRQACFPYGNGAENQTTTHEWACSATANDTECQYH